MSLLERSVSCFKFYDRVSHSLVASSTDSQIIKRVGYRSSHSNRNMWSSLVDRKKCINQNQKTLYFTHLLKSSKTDVHLIWYEVYLVDIFNGNEWFIAWLWGSKFVVFHWKERSDALLLRFSVDRGNYDMKSQSCNVLQAAPCCSYCRSRS